MKITGGRDYIEFDMENGYVMKAKGEILIGEKFVVYKDTMTTWETPHEEEVVSEEQKSEIIQEVINNMNENTVQILFE